MGEIILANAVQRRKGYLYYVDGEGSVCEAELKRGRQKDYKTYMLERQRLKRERKKAHKAFIDRNNQILKEYVLPQQDEVSTTDKITQFKERLKKLKEVKQ